MPRFLHASPNLVGRVVAVILVALFNFFATLQELASEVKRTDDAPGTSSESARQRTRKSTLREIKSEEVLPRSGSLNRFSEEAASLT